MLFALGYIAGLVTAFLILFCINLFANPIVEAKKQIDMQMNTIKRNLELSQTGFVYTPPDDEELARQAIIEKNQEEGRDTPIKDLQ